MASFNKVLLMGNLTREPELRHTPGGTAVCDIGLAVNRRFTGSNNEQRDETCFVDIVVWGKQAESCGRYLEKGSAVFIEGRLQYDQWQDKETGRNRSKLRVNAERVQFLNRASQNDQFGQQQQDNGFQQQGGFQQNQNFQQPNNQGGFQQNNPNGGFQQPNNNGFQQQPGGGAPQNNNSNWQQQQPPAMPDVFDSGDTEDDIPF